MCPNRKRKFKKVTHEIVQVGRVGSRLENQGRIDVAALQSTGRIPSSLGKLSLFL